jgi:hypothetical protein
MKQLILKIIKETIMKQLSVFVCTVMLMAATCLVVSTPAFAISTVFMDGILSAGEYTGVNSDTKSLLWWNDHHSIYTKDAGNINDLYWERSTALAHLTHLTSSSKYRPTPDG